MGLHADLKAENVLVTLDRGRTRIIAKLTDFGLAVALDPRVRVVVRLNWSVGRASALH